MDSRTLFKVFISSLIVSSSFLGCSSDKTEAPLENAAQQPTQTQVNPQSQDNTALQLEFKTSEMAVDNSGPVPRFQVSKPLELEKKIQIHFDLDSLSDANIAAREQYVVPFVNGNEVPGSQWSVENPIELSPSSLGNVEISKDSIKEGEAAAIKFYNITEDNALSFKLRIIFSDSAAPERNSLAVIEVPLSG